MTAIVLIVLLILAIVLVFYGISTYNRLISERLKVDNQWSQIDIVLKQRCDTIPNLVSVVSGYAAHEKALFERVTNARSRYLNASSTDESVLASADLSREVRQLFAVAENYPELKANANFMDLQQKLAALEEKIADFRQFYNDMVMRYNRQIMVFPASLIAGMFHFTPREFYKVEEDDKTMPKVTF